MVVAVSDVHAAVLSLLQKGWAQSYELSSWGEPPKAVSNPATAELGAYYFFPTEQGRRVQSADYEGWPFDDDGSVRDGWRAPDQ